jgi:hypothetical protein
MSPFQPPVGTTGAPEEQPPPVLTGTINLLSPPDSNVPLSNPNHVNLQWLAY